MLNRKTHYLQIALNSTLSEAEEIIRRLPPDERILIEAGTPLIKEFGAATAIRYLRQWWQAKVMFPYIVADLKAMDRGMREVEIAAENGASAAVALGQAPIETLNIFIETCAKRGLDSMIDMMNAAQPVKILRQLKRPPDVVILHRGVDEEIFNKSKPVPYVQINKIRASFNVMISVAGGDTIREVQRAIFNSANIAVVWKPFYQSSADTARLAEEFLKEIR
ncbi:MAG: hypothetical protein Q8L57_01005 [bacterium]|nr:hypothetical protein [bacterium]